MEAMDFARQALEVCQLNPKHTDLVVLATQAALKVIDYWSFALSMKGHNVNPEGISCLRSVLNLGAPA